MRSGLDIIGDSYLSWESQIICLLLNIIIIMENSFVDNMDLLDQYDRTITRMSHELN
jgi:hypothetical protein